jgi:hypothetical protein
MLLAVFGEICLLFRCVAVLTCLSFAWDAPCLVVGHHVLFLEDWITTEAGCRRKKYTKSYSFSFVWVWEFSDVRGEGVPRKLANLTRQLPRTYVALIWTYGAELSSKNWGKATQLHCISGKTKKLNSQAAEQASLTTVALQRSFLVSAVLTCPCDRLRGRKSWWIRWFCYLFS